MVIHNTVYHMNHLISLGGWTARVFVLLWFLSMALHQDDLPPPPVRLPADQDVSDAEIHREEIPPGPGWHPSLTGASSQTGASKQY